MIKIYKLGIRKLLVAVVQSLSTTLTANSLGVALLVFHCATTLGQVPSAIASQLEIARQELQQKRAQLQLQLKALDAEAEQLKVKSPYNGVIRRLKVERASNRQLTVTLVIQSKEVAR